MRRTTALRGAAALIALLPAAAMAERGADGHLNIIYYQAPSILNPYLSGGTKDIESSSLIIEPQGDWGRGVVQLVEIPTESEANDNIVAFWVPEERPEAGSQYEFRYRMRWGLIEEMRNDVAVVLGTFAGLGGNAAHTGDINTRRFEINFDGGTAANLPGGSVVEPIVDIPQNARIEHIGVNRLPGGGWRLSIELEKLDSAPVELRAKLAVGGRVVSEVIVGGAA